MKKIIAKSALALAIATISGGVFAGTLTATATNLAKEIFGDGTNAGANAGSTQPSAETLITVPSSLYHIEAAHTFVAADQATVKVTLGGNAVFGEDLSSIAKWGTNSTANVTFEYDALVTDVAAGTSIVDDAVSALYTVTVESGGAIGDNTVVFRITAAAPGTEVALKNVKLDGVKIKNLTSALGATGPGKVELSTEFRLIQATPVLDSALKKVVLTSSSALKGVYFEAANGLISATSSQTWADVRQKIQVTNGETTFTNNIGSAAGTDYNIADDNNAVDLGVLKVVKDPLVMKEDGSAFDIQASDEVKLTLTGTKTFWDSVDKFYLVGNGNLAAPAPAADCSTPTVNSISVLANTTDVDGKVNITLTGQTTDQLGQNTQVPSVANYLNSSGGYRVCVTSKNAAPTVLYTGTTNKVVEGIDSIKANAKVEFFNSRYFDVASNTAELGGLTRNGCSVTLFNLPAVGVADDAFIRLTNLSSTATPGSIKATVWAEDGRLLDERVPVLSNLPAHATAIFHTDKDLSTAGTKVSLYDALPKYKLETSGRARIVLTGAFPACEALGLIRTPNGPLVNMTSTTYSGDSSKFGQDTNGTSNTGN